MGHVHRDVVTEQEPVSTSTQLQRARLRVHQNKLMINHNPDSQVGRVALLKDLLELKWTSVELHSSLVGLLIPEAPTSINLNLPAVPNRVRNKH